MSSSKIDMMTRELLAMSGEDKMCVTSLAPKHFQIELGKDSAEGRSVYQALHALYRAKKPKNVKSK